MNFEVSGDDQLIRMVTSLEMASLFAFDSEILTEMSSPAMKGVVGVVVVRV